MPGNPSAVREVLEAEKAGYDFSGVTDTALQEAFLRGEDLRELATQRQRPPYPLRTSPLLQPLSACFSGVWV